MRKALRWLGIIVILLIVVAIMLPFLIPAEKLKGPITQAFKEASGQTLVIGGALKLSFFPYIGAYAEDVAIKDDKEQPTAKMKSLDVGVALVPLLSGDIDIKKIALDTPEVYVRVNESGANNWQQPAAGGKEKAPGTETASTPRKFRLSGITVKNGTVHYDNRKTGDKYTLSDINLDISLSGLDSPLSADGGVTWNGKQVTLKAEIGNLEDLQEKEKTEVSARVKVEGFSAVAKGYVEKDTFSGNIEADADSVSKVLVWLDPKSKPSTATDTNFSLKTAANCSAAACTLSQLMLAYGKIEAKGEVKAAFDTKVPVIDAKLTTGELDITPFLPPQKHASNLFISDAYAATAWSTEPMNLSALRAVNGNIDVEAAGVRAYDVKIGKTTVHAKLKDGTGTINVPDAAFYGGTVSGNSSIDASGNYQKTFAMKDVRLADFLKDAAHDDQVSGTATITGSVSGKGLSIYEMVSTMQGNGSLLVRDGAWKGANIAEKARNVQSAFRKLTSLNVTALASSLTAAFDAPETSAKKTDFAELSGNFTIHQGIVSNSDLAVKAPLMRVSGKGTVDLPQKTIDYRLIVELVETAQGQGGKDKQGIPIPVLIQGDLENPQPILDAGAVVQLAAKNLRSTVEEVLTKPGDPVKNAKEAIKDLKGLFKKKSQ